MKFETYKEYKDYRNNLYLKAEELLETKNFNDIKEAERIIDEIKALDEDHKDLLLNNANENAYKDNYKPTNIFNKSANIEEGKVIDSIGNEFKKAGEKMDNLFLNKGEKLADRVNVTDENNILNKEGALGNVIRGIVTGQWESTELKNVVTTTATGTLIPEVLSSKVIDLARELSLFTNAGVPIVPMSSDNMTISRIKNDPVFGFKAEGEEGKNVSFELDSVNLKSKTAYGYAYITLEAIKSSQNLDSIVRQVFAQAMANTIDKAFLYGEKNLEEQVEYAPLGIMNDENINSIVSTSAGYDDFIKAIGKIRKANGNPTVYGINADTEELLGLLKDNQGKYLEKPKTLENLNQIVSNQLKSDISEGNDAIVFDPMALLIGIQNNIQIKIIEDAECLKKGLIGFQIYSMLDCAAVQPKHICKITGIK